MGDPAPAGDATAARPRWAATEPPPPHATHKDPLAEALRVIDLADRAGLEVRLMGGLAFHVMCPDWTARIDRDGRDIDLATRARDRKPFTELLVGLGYLADKQYNALFGHKQLYFVDPEWARPVDVLIDQLEMCHRFEFGNRLAICDPTLPPAELLLSKLQVVKINRKDILDVLALLSETPLAGDDVGGAALSLSRITDLTSTDWGWWRTVTGNLAKLEAFVTADLRPDDLDFGRETRFDASAQIGELRQAIEASPKSTRWKLRARVGDKVAWYQEPEEVGHGR